MNKPVTDTEIKALIKKNFPKNKSPGPDGFKGVFYQIQRRANACPSETLPNNFREGTLPKSFYEATITMISKPDKDIMKKKKLQTNITDEHRCKNSQQNSIKQNSRTL